MKEPISLKRWSFSNFSFKLKIFNYNLKEPFPLLATQTLKEKQSTPAVNPYPPRVAYDDDRCYSNRGPCRPQCPLPTLITRWQTSRSLEILRLRPNLRPSTRRCRLRGGRLRVITTCRGIAVEGGEAVLWGVKWGRGSRRRPRNRWSGGKIR